MSEFFFHTEVYTPANMTVVVVSFLLIIWLLPKLRR